MLALAPALPCAVELRAGSGVSLASQSHSFSSREKAWLREARVSSSSLLHNNLSATRYLSEAVRHLDAAAETATHLPDTVSKGQSAEGGAII